MAASGTYVYCVVAAKQRPLVRQPAKRLAGIGPVRLLDVDRGLWLAVADAPLNRFSEDALNARLSDLDWVSRAAVAHEAVVESFLDEFAILPMKLFTIFTSEDRAIDQVRGDKRRVAAAVKRVANHLEWGIRVMLVRPSPTVTARPQRKPASVASGASYLSRKKAQRDAAAELAERAQETVAVLYDRLAARSRLGRRRPASELPRDAGPLLLDAAFLVPRSRSAGFRTLVAREAKRLGRLGYRVALTGPWPPYTFVKD
jgi:gas vesicle protein GvpL/GvpF